MTTESDRQPETADRLADLPDDPPVSGRVRAGIIVGILTPYALAGAILAANRTKQVSSDEFILWSLSIFAAWTVLGATLLRRHVRGMRALAVGVAVFTTVFLALITWAIQLGGS